MGMRKFEHLLRYKPFILRTDSKCMQFLNSLKEVRGIYARWLNFIQGFDFEVVHRPGVTNQHADALSGMEQLPETAEDCGEEEKLDHEEDVYAMGPGEVETWMIEDPLKQQKQDPVLREVIRWVEEKQKPDVEKMREAGSEYLVYRGVFERLHLKEGSGLIYHSPEDDKDRLCLPEDCFTKAFDWIHSHPSAGHFGIGATQKKFKKRFFLPVANTRIVTEVSNCINCIQKKNFVKKDQHVFHRTLETHPMERVYIDLVGPLPRDEYRGQKKLSSAAASTAGGCNLCRWWERGGGTEGYPSAHDDGQIHEVGRSNSCQRYVRPGSSRSSDGPVGVQLRHPRSNTFRPRVPIHKRIILKNYATAEHLED